MLRLHAYIDERNPAAADCVIERIHHKLTQLSKFPFIGPERPSTEPGLRGAVVRNCMNLYRVEGEIIIVSRVIDGRRDIDEEFWR